MFCLRYRAVPSTLRTYASPETGLRSMTPFNTTTTTSRPFSLLSRQPTTTTTTTPITSTLSPSTSPTITTSPLQTRPFSASASLAAKRTTYNPSRRVQKRRHGFLARLRTRSGRMILKNRRAKGKKALSW